MLVDELGRGTSTYDGMAIACSVLKYLLKLGPKLIFSTHYHLIVDWFKFLPIKICTMAYTVEQNKLTYLYRLESGSCESSFGLNIARVAGLP